MAVIAYLNFRSESEEVIEFYREMLDGSDIKITRFDEMPEDPNFRLPESDKKLIANGSIKFAGGVIMLSDVPSFMADNFSRGNNLSLAIILKDKELIEKYFNNLAKNGGVVDMPLTETSWSKTFGMVTDKYGVH